jgi:hypothetical protein
MTLMYVIVHSYILLRKRRGITLTSHEQAAHPVADPVAYPVRIV